MVTVLSLLSPEERAWAYENRTYQVTSEDTQLMVVHVPYSNGVFNWDLLPEELKGGLSY